MMEDNSYPEAAGESSETLPEIEGSEPKIAQAPAKDPWGTIGNNLIDNHGLAVESLALEEQLQVENALSMILRECDVPSLVVPEVLTLGDVIRASFAAGVIAGLNRTVKEEDLIHPSSFLDGLAEEACEEYGIDTAILEQPIGVVFS